MTGSKKPNAALPRRRVPDYNHRTRIPAWAIRDLVERIAVRFKPEKIILFGSYARGDFTRDSDVDLLVVMDTRGMRRPSLIIRRVLPFEFAVDLIVLTPKQLLSRLNDGDCLLSEAVAQGRTLYDSNNAGMGLQGGTRLPVRHRTRPTP